jgi:hypothetical protein
MPSDLPPGSPAAVPPPSPEPPVRRSPPAASPLPIGLAESSWFVPAQAPVNAAAATTGQPVQLAPHPAIPAESPWPSTF